MSKLQRLTSALNDHGLKLYHQHRPDLAMVFFRHILAVDPTNQTTLDSVRLVEQKPISDVVVDPLPKYLEALHLLTVDDPEGWRLHEECYDQRSFSTDNIVRLANENPYWFARTFEKRWHGQRTRHLLVSTEQGFGDNIQFMRYLPFAAQRCERLSVALPTKLYDLARHSFPGQNINYCQTWPTDFDHYCLIMSLGVVLDIGIPHTPYLSVPFTPIVGAKPRVGVAWRGNDQAPHNGLRSIPFEQFRCLLTSDAEFISLQIAENQMGVEAPLDGNATWVDSAQLIQTLDLVISVDTAVAHMAGALNKPVWLINRRDGDWRWGLEGEETAWYPAMRIFRQDRAGDWQTVIQRVKEELNGWLISVTP